MLSWSLAFFILSVVSAGVGFAAPVGGLMDIGQILFVVFIVLFFISLVVGMLEEGR